MKYAFEIRGLHKTYGKVKALSGVTLKAKEGQILGLLGPNGAGKSTIVKILSTLARPTKGSVKVHGVNALTNPDDVRRNIGLAGQFAAVDEFLTGRENIMMVGQLYGLDKKESKLRASDILEKLSLSKDADRAVRTYSGGMRRRLDLGASLVGQPKILFLDEPTTGLDPRTRQELWEIIRQLKADGTSILLTTQYLEEADELADKIAIIDQGKLIAEGTSAQLKRRLGGDLIEIEFRNAPELEKAIKILTTAGIARSTINPDEYTIKLPAKNSTKDLLLIAELIQKNKLHPNNIGLHKPSLDDVFLTLTNRTASAQKPKRRRKGRV